MKKIVSLITISMMLLTGCSRRLPSATKTSDFRDTRIVEVYEAYKANGGTLDYDTWLSSIKGEKGDTGDKGTDGQSIITGKGKPSNEVGNDGDSYVDTKTWNYYIKSNGTWSLTGNIKGNKGDTGDKGDTGLSAYEEYKKSHPEYTGNEKQWLNDLVNGRLADKRKFKTIFYLNGEVYKSSEVTDGDYLVLPENPGVNGKKFTGWYLDKDCNSKVPGYYKVTQDTYLYAGFINNTYNLTLHADSETKKYIYTFGDPLSCLPTPIKNGYDFLGWYTDSSFENKLEDYQFGNVTFDLDLYAKFSTHSYKVRFLGIDEYDLAESSITVDVDHESFKLPSFETDDKAIVAWKIDGKEYSPNDVFSYSSYFGNSMWSDLTFVPVYGTYGLPSDYEIEKGDYNRYVLTKYIGSGKQVVIPDYIKASDGTYHLVSVIGSDAFKDVDVTSIVLSKSIKVLKEEAFAYTKGITEITIPQTVTTVENNIFMGCPDLVHVTYQTTAYPSVGTIFKVDSLKKVTFDCYQTPYNGCFGCTNLEEVELTDKVQIIGGHCFQDCRNLKKCNFPRNLIDLGFYSFYGAGIENVVIPDKIVKIDNTFRDCVALKYVIIPKSVRSIEGQAFYLTRNYKTFYLGTANQWNSISISSDSESIADNVYFYSETEPVEDGKFWHYVDGEPSIWETDLKGEE